MAQAKGIGWITARKRGRLIGVGTIWRMPDIGGQDDDLARILLEHVGSLGYSVQAVENATGEGCRVGHERGERYQAVCELARLGGGLLEDG